MKLKCLCPFCNCGSIPTIADTSVCRQCRLGAHASAASVAEGVKRYVVFTANSVWLVSKDDGRLYIEDRATFGSPYISDGRRFEGLVESGELRVGSRLRFINKHENDFGKTDREVATGAITRVVDF